MYIHICVPNILSLYYVTCMYIFRANHLALEDLLMCPSLGQNSSLAPSFPRFAIVLCVGLRPSKLFPVHFGTPPGVVLVHVVSHSLTANSLTL